jgi:hypothetical protein
MGWISDPAEPLLRAPSARMCAAADSFIGSTSRPAVISDTESAGEWGTRESECTGMTPRMGGLGLPLLPAEAPPLVPPLLPLALDSLLRVTAGGSGAIAGSFCCTKHTALCQAPLLLQDAQSHMLCSAPLRFSSASNEHSSSSSICWPVAGNPSPSAPQLQLA